MAYKTVTTWQENAKGQLVRVTKQVWVPDAPKPAITSKQVSQPTVKPPVVKPPVAAPRPKAPAPTFAFNGKVYTSQAAYQIAVRQHQQRIAYERSVRLQQERAAAAARELHARAQQQARLMGIENVDQKTLKAAERARLELDRIQRQQREAELAKRRRVAYEAIQRRLRSMGVLAAQQRLVSPAEETKAIQQSRATKDRQRTALQERTARGLSMEEVARSARDIDRPNEPVETVANRRRRLMLENAAETGRYADIFTWIRDKAVATGGRFLDQRLYETAMSEYIARTDEVTKSYAELMDELNRLGAEGDWQGALEILDSEEYQVLESRIAQLKGDGRVPGEMESVARISQEIGQARDAYLERVLLQQYAGQGRQLLVPAQVQMWRDRFAEQFGSTAHEDPNRPREGMSLRQWSELQFKLQEQASKQWAEMSLPQRYKALGMHFYAGFGWGMEDQDGQLWILKPGMEPVNGQGINREAFEMPGASLRREQLKDILGGPGMVELAQALKQLKGESYIERNAAQRAITQLVERQVDVYWRTHTQGRYAPSASEVPTGPISGRYGQGMRDITRIQESARDKEALVAYILEGLGIERPGGVVGAFDKAYRAPVLGQLLGGLDLARSSVWARLWDARVALHGRESLGTVELPTIYFRDNRMFIGQEDATTGRNVPLDLTQAWDYSNQDEIQAMYDEYRRVMDDPGSTWEQQVQATLMIGSMGRTGNSMLLFDAATDPLSFVAPARFLRTANLAIGEAGGLRAALNQFKPTALKDFKVPGIAPVLKDYAKFATPAWMTKNRTLHIAERTKAEVYQHLARGLGVTAADVKKMSLEEVRDALQRLAKGQPIDEVRAAVPGFGRMLEGKKVNTQQLMSFAEAEIKRQQGLVVHPRVVRDTINDAIREQELAESALRNLEEITQANASRIEGGTALHAIRQEIERAGGPAAPSSPVPVRPRGGQAAKVNRLRAAVENAMRERVAIARRTAEVAKRLQAHTAHDTGFRQLEWRQLEEGIRELNRYRDIDTPRGTRQGLVSQAEQRLRDYRRSIGLTPDERPSFGTYHKARLADDQAFLVKQIQHARMMRDQAKAPAQRKIWEGRLAKLHAAVAGLNVERELAEGGKGVARRIMKRAGSEVTKRFSPNRVARPVFSERGATEELLREIHVRATTREVERLGLQRSFTEREAAVMQNAVEAIQRAEVKTKTPELKMLTDELGQMTLYEAILVVQAALDMPGGFSTFRETLDSLLAEAAHLTGVEGNDLLIWLGNGHNEWGQVFDLEEFRKLDQAVRTSLVRARGGRTRKGAERAVGTRVEGRTGAFVLRDSDPATVLTKIRTLGLSITPQQYDELRTALGDISRRDYVQRSFLKKAQVKGGDVRESFLRQREARRSKEAFHDLEEYANRRDRIGLTDEEVFALWKAEHSMDDLAPTITSMTPYMAKVLDHSFKKIAGFGIGERHLVKRVLGGINEAPKGARLAKTGEFGGVFDDTGIPVFVVPKGHPRLRGNSGLSVDDEGIFIVEDMGQVGAAHELFHQFQVDPANAHLIANMRSILDGLDEDAAQEIWRAVKSVTGHTLYREEEMLAELYAWSRLGSINWPRLLNDLDPKTQFVLHALQEEFRKLGTISADRFGFGVNHPPLGNRAKMRAWLVENGFWSPKTAEEIKSGARVWSIEDERAFWQANYGFEPEWTKPEVLKPLLDNPEEYFRKFREWGFFDDDFEILAAQHGLRAISAGDRITFGADGVKAARSFEEMRDWFSARYGSLVASGAPEKLKFHAVPWLMTFDEYAEWMGKVTSDPARVAAVGLGLDQTLVGPDELAKLGPMVQRAVERHLTRVKEQMRREGNNPDLWLPEERKRLAYDIVDQLLGDRGWMKFFDRAGVTKRAELIGQIQRTFIVWVPAFPIMNAIDSFGPKAALLSIMRNRGRWVFNTEDRWDEWVPNLDVVGDSLTPTWGVSRIRPWTKLGDEKYEIGEQLGALGDTIVRAPLYLSAMAEGKLRLAFARSVAGRTIDDLLKTGMDLDTAILFGRFEAHRALKTFFSALDDAPEWLKIANQIVPFLSYHYKNAMLGLRVIYEAPWVASLGQRLGMYIEGMNRRNWEQNHPGEPFPEHIDAQRLIVEAPWGTPYTIDLGMFSDWTRALKNLQEDDAIIGPDGFIRVPHPWQTALLGLFTGEETIWGAEPDIENLSPWFEFFEWLGKGGMSGFDPNDPKSKDLTQIISQFLFFKAFGRIPPVSAKVQTFFGLLQMSENLGWDYYNEHPDLQAYFQRDGRNPRTIFDTRKWSWHAFASDEEIAEYDAAMAGLDALDASFDKEVEKFYLEPWSREYRQLKLERKAARAAYIRAHPILTEAWMWTRADYWAEQADDFRTDLLIDDFFSIRAPKRSAFDSDLAYQEAMLAYLQRRERFLEVNPSVYDALYAGHNAVERAWFQHELHWSEILEDQAHIRIAIAEEEAKVQVDRDKLDVLYRISDANYQRLDQEAFGQFYDLLGVDLVDNRPNFVRNLLNRGLGRIRELVAFPGRADFFYEIANDRERVAIVEDEKYFVALGDLMHELKLRGDFSTFWTEMRNRGLLDRYLRENPNKRVDYEYSVNIARIFAAGPPIKFWDRLMAEPAWLNAYLARNPEKRATYNRILVGKRYYNEMQALWNRIGDDFTRFYDELAKNPWLQQQYFARNPEKVGRGRSGGMSAYGIAISAIFNQATDGRSFYRLLAQNPALMAEYFRRHPDAAARYRAGQEYFGWISRWVEALKRDDFTGAQAIWDSMPSWVHDRYFARHPDSGMRDGIGGDRSDTPERRRSALQGSSYAAAIGRWVELLRAREYVQADEWFRSMPSWMQERYFERHPDQRAKHQLTSDMLRIGAEYFLAPAEADKLRILQENPQLAIWLKEHGGNEAAWRGLIFAIYRAIPASDGWIKRKFRNAYPELFGQEAQGERRRKRVAQQLAAHPEMVPFYEKALALQLSVYQDQLKRSRTAPKPIEMQRKSRLAVRRKRRAARLHSQWSTHQRLRRF